MSHDLYDAAVAGDLAALSSLLSAAATPTRALQLEAAPASERDSNPTPLFAAARAGQTLAVEMLVEAGANLHAEHPCGATSLYIASQQGHEQVVGHLLRGGARVDQGRTDNGATALHMASQYGFEKVVALLLKAGADANQATTDDGKAPLHMASEAGHEGVVTQLLAGGANKEQAMAVLGCTPLFVATQRRHLGVVALLKEAGALQ